MNRLLYVWMFFSLGIVGGVVPSFGGEMADEAGRVAAVINNVIEAYGGKEAIGNIHTLRARGTITTRMSGKQGVYEVQFKRDRKLFVETRYGDSWERRILNGTRGYRTSDRHALEEVSGPRYLSMLYQYKHLNLLYDLVRGAYQIRPGGRDATYSSLYGNDVEKFTMADNEGAVIETYIDTRTSYIIKVVGYFKAGDKTTSLSAEFSDFKKVDGRVFPFKVTNFAGGLKIAETVIETYTINPDIPDSLFMPLSNQSL
ncbi:MAG: hypothetical protein ACOYW7_00020 [Nitrospirota bacterium]